MNVGITFGLFVFLVLANYRLSGSVLYPPFIFCMMWLFDLFVYCLHLVEMDTINSKTLLVISIGAILFSIGGSCAFLVPRSLIRIRIVLINTTQQTQLQQRSKLVKVFLIAALAVGVFFMIRHTFADAMTGAGDSFLSSARNAAVENTLENGEQFSILTYVLPWSIYAAVLFSLEGHNRSFWIMTGIAFIACVFSTGRTPFLFLVSALTATYLLKRNQLSFLFAMRFARWPILGFLLLFTGLIFTNKDTSSLRLGFGGVALLLAVNYIVGPTAALNYFLGHQQEYSGLPNHTFKFFLKIASALHFVQYTSQPIDDAFVLVPF